MISIENPTCTFFHKNDHCAPAQTSLSWFLQFEGALKASIRFTSRLQRGGGRGRGQARRHTFAQLQHDGDPQLVDEGGQHGRRHPVLHQVFHPQTGRVLLQDMVLCVQAVQMSPEEVFFPRREEEKKKLFYFLSNECSVIFFRRIWCDPFFVFVCRCCDDLF